MIMELPDTAVMMASECSLECVCNIRKYWFQLVYIARMYHQHSEQLVAWLACCGHLGHKCLCDNKYTCKCVCQVM